MRILIINNLYPPIILGGAEKSVSLLAEALVRSGDEVSVVTLHPGTEESTGTVNGVKVYRLPMDNLYWPFDRDSKPSAPARLRWHIGDARNLHAAKRVGRILDMEKPDVVHSNVLAGFSVGVWEEVKKRKIRLVHTLRDYYLLCSRSALFRGGSTCTRRCADCTVLTSNRREASQMVDAVVSISDFVLKCHTQRGYFSRATSSIIYNIGGTGVPLQPRDDAPDGLVFGYVGRLVDEKGIRVVLEATTRLSASNWRLRIAGVGFDTYVNALKREFTDPRIEWLGFVNPQEFYGTIDVTVVSSVWPEPLSRIVIETFGAGKSAICAQSGGIPEIAKLGKVVATYPPKDVRALASVMERALLNAGFWRGGGFRDAAALDLFSDRAITRRYQEIYAGSDQGNAVPVDRKSEDGKLAVHAG